MEVFLRSERERFMELQFSGFNEKQKILISSYLFLKTNR